jgi:hypothetical protein
MLLRTSFILLIGYAFVCIGCSEPMAVEFEEFTPVQIGVHLDPFTFHPDYWKDPDFVAGLPLLLDDYGHEYKKVYDRVMVREHMASENGPHRHPSWHDELEYRCNLTTKAFAYGRASREKMKNAASSERTTDKSSGKTGGE